jgi:hypothetical protein
MSIHMAIHRAALRPAQKAVAWSLLGLSDWSTGDQINATVEEIARGAGLRPRATGIVLEQLEALGFVVFIHKSRGRESHRLSLNGPAMKAVNPAADAGLNPARRARLPRTGRRATPHPVRCSSFSSSEVPQPPQATARSWDVGGGGGEIAPGAEERAFAQPAYDELLRYGVSAGKAARLAACHSLEEIRAGIHWVSRFAKSAHSRPALLVNILGDGTAAEALRAATAKVKKAALVDRVGELSRWSKKKGRTPSGVDVARLWRDIDRVWESPDAVVDSGVLAREQLAAQRPDGWALLTRLHSAAMSVLAHRGAGDPGDAGLGSGDIEGRDGVAAS